MPKSGGMGVYALELGLGKSEMMGSVEQPDLALYSETLSHGLRVSKTINE